LASVLFPVEENPSIAIVIFFISLNVFEAPEN
jgi:hypothetical protein